MNKYIITFGSGQLSEIAHKVNPMKVMLVMEAENEGTARDVIMNSFIGRKFCTSYKYESHVANFKHSFNMKEYSLKDLEKMRTNEA